MRILMMDKSTSTTISGLLTAILLAAGIWTCTPTMESTGNPGSSKEEGSMNLEKHSTDVLPAIPALDAAAPAEFETASFGLG